MVQKYLNKVSGPLMDRIDMHIDVQPIELGELQSAEMTESSESIRNRVEAARNIQLERFKTEGIYLNASMNKRHLKLFCSLDEEAARFIGQAMER